MAIALADILDERHIALQLKSRRQANALREIIGLLEKTGSVLQPAEFLAQVAGTRKSKLHPDRKRRRFSPCPHGSGRSNRPRDRPQPRWNSMER